VSFGGECSLEVVEDGVESAYHLWRVGSAADDLGERKREQGLEASELAL
jgi:hypothetical protein